MASSEYDFPTVRTGSLWLLAFTGFCVARGLYWGWTNYSVQALQAILAALAGTHTVLVLGKGFIRSKWGDQASGMVEETTTVKKVTPADSQVKNVELSAENVNVSEAK